MKTIKRLFIGLISLIVLLVIALIVAPIFFKDEIVQVVKKKLNEELDAKVEFQDVHISLLRSFPQVDIRLDEFNITGIEEFEGVHLMDLEQLQLGMDLMSVLKKSRDPEVERINLHKPDLNIVILENGSANYNIYNPAPKENTPEKPKDESGEVLTLQIEKINIEEAHLLYDDRSSGTYVKVADMNLGTSANIKGNSVSTKNDLDIQGLTFKSGGVEYMDKGNIDIETDLLVDLDQMKFEIGDNRSIINELVLVAEGTMQMGTGYQDYDIDFRCPSDEFDQFLSLLPGAYTADFDKVKTSGKLGFEGWVKGRYSENSMPDIDIRLAIDNGAFQYPDFDQEIKDIFADVSVNMRKNLKDIKVAGPRFDFSLDGQPLHTAFTLENALQDPHVVAEAQGKLDLAKLANAYPVPGVKSMSGVVDLDVAADINQSEITKENYSNLKVNGTILSDELQIQYGEYPNMTLTGINSDLSPRSANLNVDKVSTPKSNGSLEVDMKDYLAYVMSDGDLEVNARANFGTLDANEFMPSSAYSASEEIADEPTSETQAQISDDEIASSFQRLKVNWDLKADEIIYTDQKIKNLWTRGSLANDEVKLKDLRLNLDESEMIASGKLTNITGYLYQNQDLKGRLNFDADYINVNKWMPAASEDDNGASAKSDQTDEPIELAKIPGNLDIQLNSKIDRLIYGNYDLKNTRGSIDLRDQALIMEDLKTEALGGKMGLAGRYETPEDGAPNFSVKYSMNEVKFQNLFNQINTFDALLPIGKFVEGLLNSEIVLEGDLTDGYMPAWETLNGQGFIQTLNGVFKETGVLKNVADKFQINEIRDIALENTKNWLSIKNGQVEVKKFDFEVHGIKCTMGGAHSITQNMDYTIVARIPKEMMEGNAVGQGLNKGIGFITDEAQKLGINMQNGDFYMVEIDLTGNIKSPQTSYKLLGTEEKDLSNLIQEKTEEVTEKIKDTIRQEVDTLIEKTRKEAEEKVEEVKDTVKKEVNKQVDTLKKKAGEEAKKLIEENLDEEGKDALNEIKNSIFKDGENDGKKDIEDALDDWNPFKKKKKKKDGN